MPTSAQWDAYDRWNQMLAEVLFPPQDVPSPVYLDIEDEVLSELATRSGVPESEVLGELIGTVAATIDLGSSQAFRLHRRRLSSWRAGNRQETNPLVGLLALFSLAAERMASGDGMSANNYYGRLIELLGAGDRDRLANSYRAVAEPFWSSLNLWLETLGGVRGLPTAYSVGMRYVGLAISQALIREADRHSLERFFSDFALAPRSELPPAELVPLLGSWIPQSPSPASNHLVTLWKKQSLQERIAEVAAALLAEWDGVEHDGGPQQTGRGRIRLVLSLTAFPRRRARLFPLFFVPQPGTGRDGVLQAERPVDVTLVPQALGALAFADPGMVEAADLLEGVLALEDPLAGRLERRPRGLVVFRRDELSGVWLEVPQVLLGDDVVVLVAERLRDATTSLLERVARPGWLVDDATPGVPEGWILIRGVEVFGQPASPEGLPLDVRALVPLTSSQLRLAGGLALPGVLRHRWHTWRAPEVRAVSDSSEGFTVRLLAVGEPGDPYDEPLVLAEWTDGQTGSVIQPLADLELEDGDYEIELAVAGNVTSRKSVALRSSDSPDLTQWSRVEDVTHNLDDPLAVIGADEGSGTVVLRGVDIDAVSDENQPGVHTPPATPWWRVVKDHTRRSFVTLRRPDPKSCFYTGAHRMEIEAVPLDRSFRPTVASTSGVCKWCGLEKRYSASYWRNKRRHEAKQTSAAEVTVKASDLPPVTDSPDLSDDWEVALDALQYAGGGSISMLERVASQIDPSRVFFKEFVLTLEALGHVEVRRSSTDLSEVSWEIAPTAIVDAGVERVLTGYWSPSLRSVAKECASANGHTLSSERQVRGPNRVATTASEDELLEWLDIDGVLLAGDSARRLVDALPPLSAVIAALPRRQVGGWLESQWFDPARAAWIDGMGIDGVGAFRVGRYASEYFYRSARDVAEGTAAISDVYLVKHAASIDVVQKPLLAWSPGAEELAVPLGASLPGLYQRAAVLDSGCAPERRRNYMVYRGVSEHVASRLTYLLMN